jgi:hypothetical protein
MSKKYEKMLYLNGPHESVGTRLMGTGNHGDGDGDGDGVPNDYTRVPRDEH